MFNSKHCFECFNYSYASAGFVIYIVFNLLNSFQTIGAGYFNRDRFRPRGLLGRGFYFMHVGIINFGLNHCNSGFFWGILNIGN